MQIKYFQTAWGDIKNSPGWFGKMCLLALVNFIPIFGQIVTFGYLYGWAREMAWGVHEPLPKSIFENGDGKFWRRGGFALITTFVFALVPGIVMGVGSFMQAAAFAGSDSSSAMALGGVGLLIYYVGLFGSILVSVLAWIGCMRVSIYDRLSAGFQLNKIWKMFRHDTSGILKILGMYLLVGLIAGFVLSIVLSMLFGILFVAGFASVAASGVTANSVNAMSDAQVAQLMFQILGSVGILGFLILLLSTFLIELLAVFLSMLVFRALGYWTVQFDVPHWRGQDDPMPFEMYSA